MSKKFITVTLIILLAALLLTGCGVKSAIVGQWQGTLNTLTFQSDGTVVSGILGIGAQGTYEFTNSDTLRITILGASTDYNVKISGDKLYLENSGITLNYTKVK